MTDPAPPRRRRLDDDVLKTAYQDAIHDRTGHLTEHEWEQLASGDMDDDARKRALSHVTSCGECSAIHRGLLALSKEAAGFDAASRSTPAPPSFAWRRWALGGGLAAAAVLVLAVLIDNPARDRRPDTVTRTNVEGASITVTKPLSLPDRGFAWTPVTNADRYEVRLSDASGALKWSTRVTATQTELPAEISLPRGSYYLQISAARDGVTIGTSPLVPVQVE